MAFTNPAMSWERPGGCATKADANSNAARIAEMNEFTRKYGAATTHGAVVIWHKLIAAVTLSGAIASFLRAGIP